MIKLDDLEKNIKFMEKDREHRKLSEVLDGILSKDGEQRKIKIAID